MQLYYNPQAPQRAGTSSFIVKTNCVFLSSRSNIEAETRWALFVPQHNISLFTSDHATKLFPKMFPNSDIRSKFACGRTKTTAIVKTAFAPHFQEKALRNMCTSFSILMDESNDKTDKSCINLVKVLVRVLEDVRTRFLDMPIINIGTAEYLFVALKTSLSKNGLDLSTVAFMSDTMNVMKGARPGVQEVNKKLVFLLVRCWVYLPSSRFNHQSWDKDCTGQY